MPLHALGDAVPEIRPDASVHPDAVIGNVSVGAEATVGAPARVRDGYTVPDGAHAHAVGSDVQRGKRFRAELRRIS